MTRSDPTFLLIQETTRQVCDALMADLAPHISPSKQTGGCLEGWCAIGAAMVTARLLRAGVEAFMVEGVDLYNDDGHVWVMVKGGGALVADPTVGQYPKRGIKPPWWVGKPLPKIHGREKWDYVGVPDWDEWPTNQIPHGPRGKTYLSPGDLQLLKLW